MKMLSMSINGLDLFEDDLAINFIAQQKITENNNESLTALFGNVYKQDVLAIIGINASGKTTALRWVAFVLDIYLQEGRINDEKYESLLQKQCITIHAVFMEGNLLYKIKSTIKPNKSDELVFVEEKLWKKKIVTSINRKNIFEFNDKQIEMIRSEQELDFLSEDISIMISKSKKAVIRPRIVDQLKDTNVNVMRVLGKVPTEIIQYLDESVQYIKYKKGIDDKFHLELKFQNQNEVIHLFNPLELHAYLSSGTIKGLNIFAGINKALQTGGFLIVDEIENHFNESVVKMIIQLFQNKRINITGATLIFSTHYAALLDEFERNDSIYISLKEDTLRLKNLDGLLKRNDFKKSEIYQSSYVGKTAPSYDAYMDLKRYFIEKARVLQTGLDKSNE